VQNFIGTAKQLQHTKRRIKFIADYN